MVSFYTDKLTFIIENKFRSRFPFSLISTVVLVCSTSSHRHDTIFQVRNTSREHNKRLTNRDFKLVGITNRVSKYSSELFRKEKWKLNAKCYQVNQWHRACTFSVRCCPFFFPLSLKNKPTFKINSILGPMKFWFENELNSYCIYWLYNYMYCIIVNSLQQYLSLSRASLDN